MNSFEFIFYTKSDRNIVEWIGDESIDYYFWGWIDMKINKESFFQNFLPEFYEDDCLFKEGVMTNSKVSKQGFAAPIFPVIESIIDDLSILKTNKKVIIEDRTGQSDKKVFCEILDNIVVLALCQEGGLFRKNNWYDGEKIVVSKKIPISNYNIISVDKFINGCINSINNYFLYLLHKYPELDKFDYFSCLVAKLEEYYSNR